jgi:methylmalonyl-CoA mutase cobalamin-binding subunit
MASTRSPNTVPLEAKVTSRLGPLITLAATLEDKIHNFLHAHISATVIVDEALEHAQATLQKLVEIEATVQEIIRHAETNADITSANLKAVLSDFEARINAAHGDHAKSMDDAWRAWGHATTTIIKAGKLLAEREEVLQKLKDMGTAGVSDAEKKRVSAAYSVLLEREECLKKAHEKVRKEAQDGSILALRRLTRQVGEWEEDYGSLLKAVDEADKAIAKRGNGN